MNLETLQTMDPMIWLIIAAALFITITVLFNKAVKVLLKLAVIGVMILLVVYFLVQAHVITLPAIGT